MLSMLMSAKTKVGGRGFGVRLRPNPAPTPPSCNRARSLLSQMRRAANVQTFVARSELVL